jgi:hypothetical protein
LVTDYLFLEPVLVERIKANVQGLKAVLTASDLAAMEEQAQIAPAAHVIYLGDETGIGPGQQGTMGKTQIVTQLWAVVIAVYHADPADTSYGNRRLAGPLIASLLRGLSGWTPQDTVKALTRGQPVRTHYANGYGYYPFVFRAEFVFNV